MARETKTREIGQFRYKVTQLKARRGHRVLERISRTILPALGTAADNIGAKPGDAVPGLGDLKKGALAEAAMKLCAGFDDETLNWLVGQLQDSVQYQTPELRAATPDGFVPLGPDLWDDHFAGAYVDEFKLLGFVLEHNFADFFEAIGGLRGALRKLVTPTQSASTNRPTATGGSGESS